MKNIGIIAEYNPFHIGHAYQLAKVRERNPRAKIIVFMSTWLVQRGEPALLDPFTRAAIVVRYGADLVLGLPAQVSCQSAEHYATALMEQVWNFPDMTVQYVGTESADIDTLAAFADKLYPETEAFRDALQTELREGKPWAQARLDALGAVTNDLPDTALLRDPNHILTLEYLLAAKREQYRREPKLRSIARIGHDDSRSDSAFITGSATALRELFRDRYWPEMPSVPLTELKQSVPTEALAELLSAYSAGALVRAGDTERRLINTLIAADSAELEAYFGSEMAARIINTRQRAERTLSLKDLMTRQWTLTRITRAATRLHLRLGPEGDAERALWLRLLAYSPDGRYVMRKLKDKMAVPIIHRAGDVANLPEAAAQFAKDRAVATLWYRAARRDPALYLTPPEQYKPIKNLARFGQITDN